MIVQLQNIKVLNNPGKFTTNFKFQITFDCVAPGVKEELEWQLVYVGSADDENNDQTLDNILVGPVRIGKNRFNFEAPPPDPTSIPKEDLLDVTVILLTCSYKQQEFIRIGYYVHNEYEEEFDENDENFVIDPHKINRNIMHDKPRVTRFNIAWDDDDKKKESDAQHEESKENDDNNDEDDDDDDEEYGQDEDEDEEEEDDDDDPQTEEDLEDTEQEDYKTKSRSIETNESNEADQDIDMTE